MGGGVSTTTERFPLSLSPEEVSHPNELEPGYFPTLGIKVRYLQPFLNLICPHENINLIKDYTTTDICEQFIRPFTESFKLSFCELLYQNKHDCVGEATVFISHAWKYNFLQVIDALQRHFHNSMDTIIWFDLFSVNQHNRANKDFSWWSTTFQEAIKKFGRTVMILSPWNDPIPLTRAWCLWELYCTTKMNCVFEIAFSTIDGDMFAKQFTYDKLKQMKGTIDVSRSEAYFESDKQTIFKAILQQTTFNKLNQLIFQKLKEWMIKILIEKDKKNFDSGVDKENLAYFYIEEGEYELAESIFLQLYEKRKALIGKKDPVTWGTLYDIATVYMLQERYELALPLLKECIEYSEQEYGKTHQQHLIYVGTLGQLYGNLKQYELALPLLEECVNQGKQLLGEDHPNVIVYLNNLAIHYNNQNHFNQALVILEEVYSKTKAVYGDRHPDTLQVLSNLAALHENMDHIDTAIALYEECFKKRSEILGEHHINTMLMFDALTWICHRTGHSNPSIPVTYEECIEKMKIGLGENHRIVLSCIRKLGKLHEDKGKLEQALSFYEQCFVKTQNLFGPDDADTVFAKKRVDECTEKLALSAAL